jgi:hypothetical protein
MSESFGPFPPSRRASQARHAHAPAPKCGAIGSLEVGGRSVAAVRCTLDAGHGLFGVDHESTLHWTDETIQQLPDLALLDPHERFDVDVPLAPLPDDYL